MKNEFNYKILKMKEKAPVTASAEILINAKVKTVWEVLTTIEGWPRWNSEITEARLLGALAEGTEFRWKAGRVSIVSELIEVKPYMRIAWSGRAPGIRAVHVWNIQKKEQSVLVHTEESFNGLLPYFLKRRMAKMLAETLKRGLAMLKSECEKNIEKGVNLNMTDEQKAVQKVVETLIENGSRYNVEVLEKIYHANLKIVKINEHGEVEAIDRDTNMEFFRQKMSSQAPPLSTAAEFNFVDADSTFGHVIVTRQMQLADRPEKSVFSILLKKESGSWQVFHETAFVQPLE